MVYRAPREYTSGVKDNRGIWYFVNREYQADKKIKFVDERYQADLVVMFTDKEYRAGWKKAAKKYLLY